MRWLLILAAGWLTLPGAAVSAPATLPLTPGDMLAETHSHALLLGNTGIFRQLSGTLRYDPATGACAIDVTFLVRSLQLPNAMIRDRTMARDFLDPADYPAQHYVGACRGGTLAGMLTMHGQTHPFDMALTYRVSAGSVVGVHAEGALNRHDWGIDGMPMLVGGTIRVTDDISFDGRKPAAASPMP